MKKYFEQFGEILEAVVITNKATRRSKGYGFREVSTKSTYAEAQSYNEDMKLTSNPTLTMAAKLIYSMAATMGLRSPRVPQSLHQKPKKVLRLTKGSRNRPSYSLDQHR
ncbi:RNA-binding protein 24 [Glycine soja]